jgi:hypothetical protein
MSSVGGRERDGDGDGDGETLFLPEIILSLSRSPSHATIAAGLRSVQGRKLIKGMLFIITIQR